MRGTSHPGSAHSLPPAQSQYCCPSRCSKLLPAHFQQCSRKGGRTKILHLYNSPHPSGCLWNQSNGLGSGRERERGTFPTVFTSISFCLVALVAVSFLHTIPVSNEQGAQSMLGMEEGDCAQYARREGAGDGLRIHLHTIACERSSGQGGNSGVLQVGPGTPTIMGYPGKISQYFWLQDFSMFPEMWKYVYTICSVNTYLHHKAVRCSVALLLCSIKGVARILRSCTANNVRAFTKDYINSKEAVLF